jgi:hypothetical protein
MLLRAVIAFTTASISYGCRSQRGPQCRVKEAVSHINSVQRGEAWHFSHLQKHRVWTSTTLAAFGTVAVREVAVGIEAPARSLGLRETVPFQELTLGQHAVVLLTVVE